MKKRFGLLSLIGATAVLIALVGAITALAAPSAAFTTADIELDVDWYTRTASGDYPGTIPDGSVLTVTVTEADANVTSQSSTSLLLALSGALDTEPHTVQTAGGEVVGTPFFLVSGACDDTVPVVDTDLNVSVFNAADGSIVVQTFNGGHSSEQRICYDLGQEDTINVTISSEQDPDGILVSATETGVDTAEFEVTITLTEDPSTTTDPVLCGSGDCSLQVLSFDTVTATFKDTTVIGADSITVSIESTVETTEPSFASISPADGSATRERRPVFSGTITDAGGSGLNVDSIEINIVGVGTFTPSVTGDEGDSSVTWTFTPSVDVTAEEEDDIDWSVTIEDVAGNVATSDSDDDTEAQDDHTVRVDNKVPTLTGGETGVGWDLEEDEEDFDDLGRLVVIFSENIDEDTVSNQDFSIEGIGIPEAAEMFSKAPQNRVYLTLASDLLTDATPDVELIGGVSDLAGNATVGNPIEGTEDLIQPTITVTLDETLIKGDEEVTISIASSEKLLGGRPIEVKVVNAVTAEEDVLTVDVVVGSGGLAWTAVFDPASEFEGDNSVLVTVKDEEGNETIKGNVTIEEAEFTSSSAIVFEQDTASPEVVTFDPEDDGDAFTANPFVTVDFDEKVTVDEALFGVDGETLVDVTALGDLSSNGETWVYAATGLTVDEDYTIEIAFTDMAGNDADDTATFTVKEKELIEIPLKPGMNLISVPNAPADTAINSVITSDDVVSVITYDAQAGTFLSATRDASGDLTGTLTTIDAMHAYWVNSSTFAPIEVAVPDPGFMAVPPSIPVVAGWNLVPIVSLVGDDPGDTTSADTYFGSTAWVTAYTFAAPSTWIKVLPGTFATVTFGNGYWLYVSQDGILVP